MSIHHKDGSGGAYTDLALFCTKNKKHQGQGEEELEQSVSIIKIPGHVVSQEFLRNMRMKGPLSQKEIFL